MSNPRLVDRIDSSIRIFLYILIFWLPYSPAVVESCVILCLILWILKRSIMLASSRNIFRSFGGTLNVILKAFKPESTFLNKPIGFFLIACILSVTSSAFFAQSFHNFLTKTLEWFIIYFLVVEVFKNKNHIYIVLGIFMFTAFSTVLDCRRQVGLLHTSCPARGSDEEQFLLMQVEALVSWLIWKQSALLCRRASETM